MTDLSTIQQKHRELYSLFLEHREQVEPGRINELLDDIVEQSAQVGSIEEFLWLRNALDQWRTAGGILRIDLSRALRIPSPDHPLKPPSVFTVWLDSDLQRRLESQANEFARRRAIQWYQAISVEQIFDLYRKALSPQRAWEESQMDWSLAEIHFASDVLDDSMDLQQITGGSYWRLEGKYGQMWLEEVKKLKAYFRWQARGGGWGQSEADDDYRQACRELNGLLWNSQRKLGQAAFEPVEAHLRQHFLNKEGKLDVEKDRVKLWTQVKGERQDWESAQAFMKLYYDNILQAVEYGDPDATTAVVQALGVCETPPNYAPMVNCLEMIVAVDFLHVEVLPERS
jgi:predicted transcriptional regulator